MSLTEIGSITLDGIDYKLGRNGGHVHLVRESIDAWGNQRGDQISLKAWLEEEDLETPILADPMQLRRVQSLLDLLGEVKTALRQQRDARLGSHNE